MTFCEQIIEKMSLFFLFTKRTCLKIGFCIKMNNALVQSLKYSTLDSTSKKIRLTAFQTVTIYIFQSITFILKCRSGWLYTYIGLFNQFISRYSEHFSPIFQGVNSIYQLLPFLFHLFSLTLFLLLCFIVGEKLSKKIPKK